MLAARLLLTAATAALLVPSAAAANDVRTRSWGGIEFSDSDRDSQASGDTLAIAVDFDTGGLVSVGSANGAQYAYRYGPDGRQTQRFRVKKNVTAVAAVSSDVYTGTSAGKVDRYGRNGKAVSSFSAAGPVKAMAYGPSGIYVATANAITSYSLRGNKLLSYPLAGVRSLAYGPEGAFVTADGRAARIYESDGDLIHTLTDVDRPDEIDIDGAGRVYVHDASQDGFGVKVFAADGRFLGITTIGFYDLQSQAKEDPSAPLLLGAAVNGDLYFTAENPDILRIPAAVVPTPRFRIDDPSRAVPQFYDTDPIAVSVGKAATFTTNVFRSLSSSVTLDLTAPAAFRLASGFPASVGVTIPVADDFAPVKWNFSVTKPGRVPVRISARGTGPGGAPTTFAKTLPVYGIDGPHISIQGAATRRGASYALVAILVDIGKTKIAKADRADLIQYLSDAFEVDTTARVGGKPVEELGFAVGESLTGMCVPFPTRGTAKIAVTARIAATDRFAGVSAKRTVKPTSRPTTSLMKDCYQAIDLAGLR